MSIYKTTSPLDLSTLERTSRQTCHDLSFGEKIEKNCRNCGQSHKSGHQRQIRTVLSLKLHGAEGQGPKIITIQDHEWGKQIVPTDNHGQCPNRGQCWPHEWEQDAPKEAERSTAVYGRRILQFIRDRQEEPTQNQDVPRYSKRSLHQNHGQERVRQVHLADHEVYRHNGNGDREHETQGQKIESQVFSPELHAGKNKGRQTTNDQHAGCSCHHDDQAVAQ